MATIPMDVLYSCILPRLPVKSLTRFKSVSKSWQTIISSPEFIHLHHHQALSSDANRLIIVMNWDFQEFHILDFDSSLSSSVYWNNLERGPKPMSILASCEFFLLIDFHGILGLALLNPSTGRYYKIPYPPSYESDNERYGIYLDEDNHDYKVVRIAQKHRWSFESGETHVEVMVYSLGTEKWRLIERTHHKGYVWTKWFSVSVSAVIGHLVHIIFAFDDKAKIKRIGCFDMLAEKWTTDVPLSQINVQGRISLTVLDGLLSVITANSDVWVMKEYGVEDSWFKLMDRSHLVLDFYPIAYRKGSRHEVFCKRMYKNEYIWYDVIGKKGTKATVKRKDYGYICKGSLVDFPGGRNMKNICLN